MDPQATINIINDLITPELVEAIITTVEQVDTHIAAVLGTDA